MNNPYQSTRYSLVHNASIKDMLAIHKRGAYVTDVNKDIVCEVAQGIARQDSFASQQNELNKRLMHPTNTNDIYFTNDDIYI